jgi:hypothetical protein
MPAYDNQQFDPPAPVAEVSLYNRQNGKTCAGVLMLLDTGADVSLIPEWTLEQLELSTIPDKQYELVSFDGVIRTAPVVELEMIFYSKTLRGRYIPVKQSWDILGRNVLNLFSLRFDGPDNIWEIQV